MSRIQSSSRDVQITVPLSKLTASRRNPRRVKPERDAHRRLVASIRAHGLLAPLVVQADESTPGNFRIIAGNRRLVALRAAFKDAARLPKVPCILRAVDEETADALALAENFVREPMHPLDEAEAFAKLAQDEAKRVESIAAEFGVSQPYVRQRMKLATLAEPVKTAYRQGAIDTGTAEAFASVPGERQLEVWQEVGGNPQHAQHVRNVIAHAWIDAASATFDLSKLPEGAVSRDLFAERVLIERRAFMEAQADALLAERQKLIEEGWAEVVVGPQADVQDRLWSMAEAPKEFDEKTSAKLQKLADKRAKLEANLEGLDGEDHGADQGAFETIQTKLEALDDEEQALTKEAEVHYAEGTKAVGTVFLLLDPDGQVRRGYRIPRSRSGASGDGRNGNCRAAEGPIEAPKPPPPPTSDELKEPQLATTFTHQALAVREAVLKDAATRKRVLALILHDKVRSEALSIRHDANGSTVHADNAEGFSSAPLEAIRKRRADLDPLHGTHFAEDDAAYEAFTALSDKKLDALIDLLTVECITAHLQRRTPLVWRLAGELGVEVRRYWRPDERWLSSYQKIQLAHLIGELRGPVYAKAAELKKKSELVQDLAKLFADAAERRVQDATLAARVNAWLPTNLREEAEQGGKEQASAA
jgi:ParB family chromosome partitioning protein